MRLDPHGLGPEPTACAAKATDHLVRDDQYIVLVTNTLDFGPVGAWRHDNPARALNGFTDERRDIICPKLKYLGLKLLRAGKAEGLGREVATFHPPVGLVDVVNAGDRHAALFVHIAHATKGAGPHRRPVIGILAADDVGFLWLPFHGPIGAHHPDVGVIRFGPRPGKEYMVQIAGGQ